MGKRISWFDMVSLKEKKQQEEKYNKLIFPFGLNQKEKELELLKQLIPSKKPEDSLYQIVLLKEIFSVVDKNISYEECILNSEIADELLSWQKNVLLKKYSDLEKDNLKKFAWMAIRIEKLDDLSLDLFD